MFVMVKEITACYAFGHIIKNKNLVINMTIGIFVNDIHKSIRIKYSEFYSSS